MASFTAPMKVDPLLKENFLALRDALATLNTEEAQAILEAARAQTTPPAPTAIEGASSNAVLPKPEPPEPDTVAIIFRNGALLADHIGGKRYLIDKPIRVTPLELEGIEAELAQRPKLFGTAFTRLERVLIHPALV